MTTTSNDKEIKKETTVATALRTALGPATYQLGVAADKTDGIANTAVNAAINAVNQVEAITLAQYDSEVDDYNKLIEQLETQDNELIKALSELNTLKEQMDGYQYETEAAKTQLEERKTSIELMSGQLHSLRSELKRLKDLKNTIMDRLESSHPQLVERYEWANETQLEDIGVSEKVIELMNSNKIFSVYDVVEKQEKRIRDTVKGFGEAGEKSLRAKCAEAVKAWESEQEKARRIAKKAA